MFDHVLTVAAASDLTNTICSETFNITHALYAIIFGPKLFSLFSAITVCHIEQCSQFIDDYSVVTQHTQVQP